MRKAQFILVKCEESFKSKIFYCKKTKEDLPWHIQAHTQLAKVYKDNVKLISGATTTPNHSLFKSKLISGNLIMSWQDKNLNHTGQFFTAHTQQYVVKSLEGKSVFTEIPESSEYVSRNYKGLNLFVKDNKLLKNPIRTYVEVLTSSSLENKHKTVKQPANVGSKKKLDWLLQKDNIKKPSPPTPTSTKSKNLKNLATQDGSNKKVKTKIVINDKPKKAFLENWKHKHPVNKVGHAKHKLKSGKYAIGENGEINSVD